MSDTKRVWEMVDAIDICMFVTKNGDDMHGRPMSTIGREEDGKIYLLTDKSAVKDDEIEDDPNVYLGFSRGSQHLSVNGTAIVSHDRALVKRVWTPSAQAFWPNGPDDPKIVAIVVTPSAAEYWDGPNGIIAGVKMAFALATGSQPDLGRNAKVQM